MKPAKDKLDDPPDASSLGGASAKDMDSIGERSDVASPLDGTMSASSASGQTGSGRIVWALHPTHRRGLAILLVLGCVLAAGRLIRDQSHIPMPAGEGMLAGELQDRIDPNEADAELLSALPGLGARRAGDIVRFRERMKSITPGGIVFRSSHDLMQVRGIGAALSAQLEPFLRFPETENTENAAEVSSPTERGDAGEGERGMRNDGR
jgi:hypothetical protein